MASLEDFRVCQVCRNVPSDTTKTHYKHYGGICCFNCKSFFKYCNDKNYVDEDGRIKYKCVKKGQGNTQCEIHYQAKQQCKKCRYIKCLQIGMDKDLIRKGTERQKYTRKKLTGFKKKPIDNHKIMEDICQAYSSSLETIIIKDNNLVKFVKDGHQPGKHWTKRHSEALIDVMNLHGNVVLDMVSKLDLLKSLCQADQKMLMDNNAKLYKYYIMARYFSHYNSNSQNATQLSWILGSESGCNSAICEKSLMEINRWAQLIPCRQQKMLARNEIFKRCLNTIHSNYQYPQSLSGIIGFFIILATNHWTDGAKLNFQQPEKLEMLKIHAEKLFQLGLNEQSDQKMSSSGQLASLIDNLHLMSLVSNEQDYKDEYKMLRIHTEFCTVFESQWVENSKNKYQESCRQNQMTGQMIQCILDGGKGDYKLYPKVKNEIHELQIQRVKYLLMANFELTLEPSAVKSILMFFYIKIGTFYNLKDHIDFATGNIKLQIPNGEYLPRNSRPINAYDLLKLDGEFLGNDEKEAMQFKEVQEDLFAFVEIEDVSHLFMMTLLLDSDDKRNLQHQYKRLLTKKLAENCEKLGTQSGDDALTTLTSLFKDYLTFTVKFQAGLPD